MKYRTIQPSPPPMPGADLITKAETVAVHRALMQAIEAADRVPTKYVPPGKYRFQAEERSPDEVKRDILDELRRMRDREEA